MLKALLKKQLYELFALLFLGAGRSNKKKKKKTANAGRAATAVILIIVFAIVFLTVLVIAWAMADVMVSAGYGWMLFIFYGIGGLLASILINAMLSCNLIFKAKDNSLLLSMPIPPKTILLTRMMVLFLNCIVVNAFCWLPAVIMYQVCGGLQIVPLVFGILMMILIGMVAIAFACLIGWFITLLTRNSTSKIILSIVGFLILFVVIFGSRAFANDLITTLLDNLDSVGQVMQTKAYPLYLFGQAACGDVLAFGVFAIICLAVFALIYFILSKTFIALVTSTKGGKHKVYKASEQKVKKIGRSLRGKEWAVLFKTPVYLINCGFGVLFFVILIILGCTQIPMLTQTVPMLKELSAGSSEMPFSILPELIPYGLVAASLFIIAFNFISFPSISLEGKSLWILKSMPVKAYNIFIEKIQIHAIFNALPAVIFLLFFGICVQESVVTIVLMIITVTAFSYLTGYFGMVIGIKRANLNWTNIAIPIKQNLGGLFCILFSMGFAIAFITIYIVIAVQNIVLPTKYYLIGFTIVFAVLSLLFDRWLKTSGTHHFLEL